MSDKFAEAEHGWVMSLIRGRQESQDEAWALAKALIQIIRVLGPDPVMCKDISCSKCRQDMQQALDIARKALPAEMLRLLVD